jgi:hypothetical protein
VGQGLPGGLWCAAYGDCVEWAVVCCHAGTWGAPAGRYAQHVGGEGVIGGWGEGGCWLCTDVCHPMPNTTAVCLTTGFTEQYVGAAHPTPYTLHPLPVLQVRDTWSVAGRMREVPGPYVAAALVPAVIISVLFYFDHNVSSQMAQQPEFNLVKGPAYHWDFLLLSGLVRATEFGGRCRGLLGGGGRLEGEGGGRRLKGA